MGAPAHSRSLTRAAGVAVLVSLTTLMPCMSCAAPRQLDHGNPAAITPVMPIPSEGGVGDGGASALRRGATPLSASTVEPWTHGTRTGERIATGHYKIRTTLRNGDMRRFLPRFVEAALVQYTSALGELPSPSLQMETWIFGSRDEWTAFTRERLGEEASAYIELGRGGYTSRAAAILYDIGPNDTLTILAHEGWHQYSQSVFREELPVWLEEGISTFMEGHRIVPETGEPLFMAWRNLERFGELRDAVRRGRLIPLEELLVRTPQHFLAEGRDQLLVYYAQMWALVHFLNEGGSKRCRDGLRELLADATRGAVSERIRAAAVSDEERRAIDRSLLRGGIRALPGSTVARVYFGSDLTALADAYRDFVGQITARGAGEAIWRGATPIKSPPGKEKESPPGH